MPSHQWSCWFLYTNWGRLHASRPISWSLKNLFTSPTLRSLFHILYPSDTPIMQALKYFNSDPTSYIHTTQTINNFFISTADTSIVSWIQDIKYVLSAVILHSYLFHHSNILIPRNHLTTSLKDSCLDIISHYLPNIWTFLMQLYHATYFG